jgi:hypothetical protein
MLMWFIYDGASVRFPRSLTFHESFAAASEAATPTRPGIEIVDAASRTFSLLAAILVVAVLIPVVFIVYRKFLQTIGSLPAMERDPREEAARLEKKGDYLAAAAALFERGKGTHRAAEMHEKAGSLKKAAELYLRSGGSAKAGGLYVKTKEYLEAAKIFRNKGDHLRAAQALEMVTGSLDRLG